MFETYVRGEWLGRRTELRVKKILEGEESLELDKLIASLQSTHDFEVKFLSEFKRKYWRAMCDYAHTGGRHIERWLTDEGIESNYARDEILEVMQGAETIASLSIVTGLARWPTTGKSFTVDGLREKLREFFRRRFARNCVPWRHSTRKVNHRTHFL